MILIVDDKKENLLSLQSILAIRGYPVHTAESGEDALKKALKNDYALIILDVQMPGMDGFEVAEMMSGYSKFNDVPIIFLSAASTEKKFITRGYTAGAVDYITKPIDPDVFLLKVSTLYKLFENKRELNEIQAKLREEIEERKKAQQESQEKARQLVSVMESIPQLAFTLDTNGEIEYTNSQWGVYSGSAKQFPLTHPEDEPLEDIVRRMLNNGEALEMETRILKPATEQYRYFLLRIVPIHESEGISRWVGTFTDINEQKLVSKRKDEFISVASHELKTPLTSLKGFIQLMERTLTRDSPHYLYVERSLMQVHKLDKLIADLLDVSKIESGSLRLNLEEFNFDSMLSACVDLMKQTHPDYAFIQKGRKGVTIRGDEARLEQVLLNFLSNAVKYSPYKKEIVIEVNSLPNSRLEVRVQDFGIGIADEERSKVFGKFYRSMETTQNFQGLGLGLYISADILQRHGAEYGVDSEPGKGSTFYFSLPYQPTITAIDSTHEKVKG